MEVSGKKNRFSPLLYLLPALVIIIAFRLLPILYSFFVSFFEWKIRRGEFLGLGQYRALIHDPIFWKSLLNTLYFVLGTMPTSLLISLFFAVLLNQKIRAMGTYRTTFFLPVITSLVAVSMVWKWIYHPSLGLANFLLGFVGIKPLGWLNEPTGVLKLLGNGIGFSIPNWLGGPSLALVAIIIMSVWKGLGYNIVLFLAGLQNIPQQLYEAARIDGAGPFYSFRRITWPLLSPTTFYVLLMTTIVSFQVFTQIYLMTGPPVGGPQGTTKVIVYYLFEKGFDAGFDRGYASAIALVLFVIILSLTLLQRKLVERRVYYG